MSETTVYLGLGSNLGDRSAQLRGAIDELGRSGVRIDARSSVYETEPVGLEAQPWFLNQVVRGRTELTPEALLDACKRIERQHGRCPGGKRFGPRPVDIDILLYGDLVVRGERLTVPHPRLGERRFMLIPLVELEPEVADPRDGTRYADIVKRLDEGKKVRTSLQNGS